MRIIRLAILANYLFWGGLAAYSIGDLLIKNVWVELFNIEQTKPASITFNELKNQNIEIQYSFQANSKTYHGSRKVFKPIADERLPSTLNEATISFNSQIPQVNWIQELDMRSRTAYVGLTISGIFLTFVVLVDIFADKQKWANKYQKSLGA